MKRKAAWWLSVAGALLILAAPLAQGATPEETPGQANVPAVRVLSSDADAIVLDIATLRPVVEVVRVGDEVRHRVSISGFDTLSQPGAPELPVQGVMLGIPPGASWMVELESTDRVVLEGPYHLLPGPSVEPASDPLNASETRTPDPAIYDRAALYPGDVVQVADSGYLRDQRFLSLRIQPVQYNPAGGQLEWFQRIRVRIRLEGSDLSACDGEQSGYFEPVLRATILNYEQAKAWRSREPSDISVQAGPICGIGPQYKVIVNAEGMHEITHADLVAAGFPVTSVDPMRLTMCTMGQEVAIRVVGQEDHVFNASDRILFYATVPYSRYTDTSTYWLSFGSSDGKRMGAKDGAVSAATPYVPTHALTATAEQSKLYASLYPSPKGDHWFWDDLQWLDVAPYTPRSYTIELKEPPAGVANAVLRVGLQGYTPDLHELVFALNGIALGNRTWAGQEYRTLSFLIPTPSLRAGANTLTLSSKDKGAMMDVVWLDSFSLEYVAQNVALQGKSLAFKGQSGPARYWLTGFSDASVEVYDVSDARNVSLITGIPPEPVRIARLPSVWKRGGASAGQDGTLSVVGQDGILSYVAATGGYGVAFQGNESSAPAYWAGTAAALKRPTAILHDPVTNWRSPALGADYLIITDPSLITEASRLVAYHQDQGLQPLVVYVQDIYDEFNHGRADPEAIRSFLQYAYDQWAMRPSYVLLFGDGSYDFLNHSGYGGKQNVPPMLADVDRTMGETATDHRYAAVHGSDILPDLYVGRIPAASLAQAHAMVDKILQYPAVSIADGWNKRITLVSDKPEAPNYNNFIQTSDDMYDWLGAAAPAYARARVYFNPSSGGGEPWVYTAIAAAKSAMMSNFNQGALFWNFMGHASEHQWVAERLLHVDDVPALANGLRLPVLLDMTCLTGQFHLPQATPSSDCLSEQLIRHPGGGTVASWSPTGWGMASGHDIMQQAFYESVFTGGIRQLGPAIEVGTVRAYNAGYNDLVDTFILLGDPALFLR